MLSATRAWHRVAFSRARALTTARRITENAGGQSAQVAENTWRATWSPQETSTPSIRIVSIASGVGNRYSAKGPRCPSFKRWSALLREGLSEAVRREMCLLQPLHQRKGVTGRRQSPLSSDLCSLHQVRRSFRRWRGNVFAGCSHMASPLRSGS